MKCCECRFAGEPYKAGIDTPPYAEGQQGWAPCNLRLPPYLLLAAGQRHVRIEPEHSMGCDLGKVKPPPKNAVQWLGGWIWQEGERIILQRGDERTDLPLGTWHKIMRSSPV